MVSFISSFFSSFFLFPQFSKFWYYSGCHWGSMLFFISGEKVTKDITFTIPFCKVTPTPILFSTEIVICKIWHWKIPIQQKKDFSWILPHLPSTTKSSEGLTWLVLTTLMNREIIHLTCLVNYVCYIRHKASCESLQLQQVVSNNQIWRIYHIHSQLMKDFNLSPSESIRRCLSRKPQNEWTSNKSTICSFKNRT